MGIVRLEFNFESPYNLDGSPRSDLPTCEVLAWDGEYWCNGWLKCSEQRVKLVDSKGIILQNVVRFAPLPTIIEENDLL